jgi:hypothetical protein
MLGPPEEIGLGLATPGNAIKRGYARERAEYAERSWWISNSVVYSMQSWASNTSLH